MRTSIARLVAIVAISAPLGLALAKGRAHGSHPHLASAQKMSSEAFEQLTAAQKANEYDLGGHAARAKALLEQASSEIGQAMEKADDNKGR